MLTYRDLCTHILEQQARLTPPHPLSQEKCNIYLFLDHNIYEQLLIKDPRNGVTCFSNQFFLNVTLEMIPAVPSEEEFIITITLESIET